MSTEIWHTFETVHAGDPVNTVWQPTMEWLTASFGDFEVKLQHGGGCSCRMMPCSPVLGRGPWGYRAVLTNAPAVALGPTPREAFDNLRLALS